MSENSIHIPGEPMVECPSCGLPAEITDRFVLDGAPEAVEHVKIVCVTRHWFTLPVDQLAASSAVEDLRDIPYASPGFSV